MSRQLRIFHDGRLETPLVVDGKNHHYLRNVLRVRPGDKVTILTSSEIADSTVEDVGKSETVLVIGDPRPVRLPEYRLTVYQCLLKREYMDSVIEKYTEIGATAIVPIISERSLSELKEKSFDRYRDIAVNAALQSEQEYVPKVSTAVPLKEVMPDNMELFVFAERYPEKSLPKPKGSDVGVFIGPEGGFEDEELDLLVSRGFVPVSPTSAILKAETAAVLFAGMVRLFMEHSSDELD